MRNIISFLAFFAIAANLPAHAVSATVTTVPTGMITCALPHGSTSYLSLPLTKAAVYTSTVTAVTANTITVGDAPAPFTTDLATSAAPYLVKFLSGAETGRVLLITGNTTSTLTLDTTDVSTQTVTLTTSGFSVAVGDNFEIVPAATLASTFGDGSTGNPLVLNGGTSSFTADTVGIYSATTGRWKVYYYNATAGYWETSGSLANANNTVLFPNSALTVTRRNSQDDGALVMSGSVAEVPVLIKTTGSGSVVFSSTGYASDMTLAQLNFGSNWVKGNSALTASTVSLWNGIANRFYTYYQKTDSTWRLASDPTTDVSDTVVSAATAISVRHRASVSGRASFLAAAMPYSL